ncbi:hypothetical protein ADUPG1_011017, partial [Aduncisulcus paluster]
LKRILSTLDDACGRLTESTMSYSEQLIRIEQQDNDLCQTESEVKKQNAQLTKQLDAIGKKRQKAIEEKKKHDKQSQKLEKKYEEDMKRLDDEKKAIDTREIKRAQKQKDLAKKKKKQEEELKKKQKEHDSLKKKREGEIAALKKHVAAIRSKQELPGFWTKFKGVSMDVTAKLGSVPKFDQLRIPMSAKELDALRPFCQSLGPKITSGYRVENPFFWQDYCNYRETSAFTYRSFTKSPVTSPITPTMTSSNVPPWIKLHLESNEQFLFHGTSDVVTQSVIIQGYDNRLGGGLLGNGAYFAEDVNKASGYSSKCTKGNVMTIALVCLGPKPYMFGGSSQSFTKPPKIGSTDFSHTCVIGRNPREFVLYHNHAAYPLYILYYT